MVSTHEFSKTCRDEKPYKYFDAENARNPCSETVLLVEYPQKTDYPYESFK